MPTIHRYTNLASTIHLLATSKLTLLNPETWDDRNDSFFMSEYKRKMKFKTVLAACFSKRPETYHHWRIFSHGADGIRITFDQEQLLESFNRPDVMHGDVRYRTLEQVEFDSTIQVIELPFLKRAGFKDESEFRIVYTSARKVTCSPETPPILS